MMIWFASDFHYNHTNIVRGITKWDNTDRCRDFETIKQYNETLIKNINDVVKEDDILYHLGDWAFGGAQEILKFRQKLRCKTIHAILGNHDHHIKRNKVLNTGTGHINAHDLFASVNDLVEKENMLGKHNVVMCHYPIKSWHKMKNGSIHLYGHTHKELDYNSRAVCVSLECHPEFRPFSFDEILNIINKREQQHPTKYLPDPCIEC